MNDNKRFNINIAICGPVSAGKSTLLNALFVSQFSEIKAKNRLINQKLIKKTENQEVITLNDIEEVKYLVPRVNNLVRTINFKQDVYLTFYDIPGLNDSRTKQVYFEYFNKNFSKFDIVIFMVDIYSALNTSDEIDILESIVKNSINSENTKLIVLANKCDDLFFDSHKKIKLDEELTEMLDQIKTTVKQKIQQLNPELEYDIIPISSENSYIYRMYSQNPECELDLKHLNKFGFNEYGKTRWNNFSDQKKKEEIKSLMQNINVNERLMISGFLDFKIAFNKLINSNNQIEILLKHLVNKFKNLVGNNLKLDSKMIIRLFNEFTELNNIFKNNIILFSFEACLSSYLDTFYSNVISPLILENAKMYQLKNKNETDLNKVIEIDNDLCQLLISCNLFDTFKTFHDKMFIAINEFYCYSIQHCSITNVNKNIEYLKALAKNDKSLIEDQWIKMIFSNLITSTLPKVYLAGELSVKLCQDLYQNGIINYKFMKELVMNQLIHIYRVLSTHKFNNYSYPPSIPLPSKPPLDHHDKLLFVAYSYLSYLFWNKKLKIILMI